MALFKLPRIVARTAITDKAGLALAYFTRFWDEFAKAIENQVNAILAVQADIQALQTTQAAEIARLNAVVFANQATVAASQAAAQAANNAQSTADEALASGTVSGSALDPSVNLSGTGWEQGPLVNLTSVLAGDLTIPGTGPQQDAFVQLTGGSSFVSMSGEFRVVEIVSMVETTVFTGSFSAFQNDTDSCATISNDSSAAVSAFLSARSSTGAVDYRLDARRVSGNGTNLNGLDLYLFVRRAA